MHLIKQVASAQLRRLVSRRLLLLPPSLSACSRFAAGITLSPLARRRRGGGRAARETDGEGEEGKNEESVPTHRHQRHPRQATGAAGVGAAGGKGNSVAALPCREE